MQEILRIKLVDTHEWKPTNYFTYFSLFGSLYFYFYFFAVDIEEKKRVLASHKVVVKSIIYSTKSYVMTS